VRVNVSRPFDTGCSPLSYCQQSRGKCVPQGGVAACDWARGPQLLRVEQRQEADLQVQTPPPCNAIPYPSL
jgi:hypothetical protein